MNISVIIPSKDQWPRLRLVLYGLTQQKGGPAFEVVIVDDGSSQPIQEQIAHEPGAFASLNLRIIRHEKNKGRSAARNTGVAQAGGKYCLFLDGDALPDRTYVAGHLEELEKEDHRYTLGNIRCLKQTELFSDPETGELNPDLEIPRPFVQTLRENLRLFTVGKADVLEHIGRIREMSEPGVIPMNQPALERYAVSLALEDATGTHPFLWSRLIPHNFGVRRADYLEVGGMNPEAVFYEGVDLSYRLLRLGRKPVLADNAVTYHIYHFHDFGTYEADELRSRGVLQLLQRNPYRDAAVAALFLHPYGVLPPEFLSTSPGEVIALGREFPRSGTKDVLKALELRLEGKPPRLAIPRGVSPPAPVAGAVPVPGLAPSAAPPPVVHQDPEFSSLPVEGWRIRKEEVSRLKKNRARFRLKLTAVISMEMASEGEWVSIHLPFPIIGSTQRLLGTMVADPPELSGHILPTLGAVIDFRFRRRWGEKERLIGYQTEIFVRGRSPVNPGSLRPQAPRFNVDDRLVFGPMLRPSTPLAEPIKMLVGKITEGCSDPLENLQRIRDWVLAHRPFLAVARCACDTCALNALEGDIAGPEKLAAVTFVHLVRGYGIPARLVKGIVPDGSINPHHIWRASIQQTGFPGCWVEIFSWDKGWLPVNLTPALYRADRSELLQPGGIDGLRVRMGEPYRGVHPVNSQHMLIVSSGQSAQLDLRPRIDVELERIA